MLEADQPMSSNVTLDHPEDSSEIVTQQNSFNSSDLNTEGTDQDNIRSSCFPAQHGTLTSSSAIGSPRFSTPISDEACTPVQGRSRRNLEIVDYKKYL